MSSLSRPLLRQQLIAGTPPSWLGRSPRWERIAQAALACPPWVNRRALGDLKREAKFRTLATGHPHVVGHIIPLCHPLVCGLTVPWNLRVMSKAENDRMGNKLHMSFQGELFEQPEQLSLWRP